jgi:hypothetical protein
MVGISEGLVEQYRQVGRVPLPPGIGLNKCNAQSLTVDRPMSRLTVIQAEPKIAPPDAR